MGLIMPVEPIDNGDGGAIYPYGINNTAVQTTGMNPNAPWAIRAISQYNRPSITQIDYADLERATEYNRLLIEERAAGRYAPDPTAQLGITLAKATQALASDIGQTASTVGQAVGSAGNWWADQLTYAPSTGVSTGTSAQVNLNSPETYYTAPEKLGFRKQQTVGNDGQVIGWSYVPWVTVSTPSISPTTPDAATQLSQNPVAINDQALARSSGTLNPSNISDADYYMGARSYMNRRLSSDWNIYEQAAYYRDNREANKRIAAIEAYGQPVQTVVNGKTVENWATGGTTYYGLLPGEIASYNLDPPSKHAPYEDWVKYVNRMQRADNVPLYKTGTARTEIDNMTIPDYREFQRRLLAAGVYPPTSRFTLGMKSNFEDEKMAELMALANRNGMTYNQVLDLWIQQRNDALASGGLTGGGGGGGGGGGSSTYTQTQYSQTSLSSARSLLSSVLTNALGRLPTDDELKRFVQMLNDAESKSPTITTTSTTSADGSTSSVSRTTPSAVDEQQMATEFAKQIGGGNEYNAYSADNYIAGLMQYLGA